MGLVTPPAEFRKRTAPADAAARRFADLRRGDDRLPPGLRRSARSCSAISAGPDGAGQDRRRRLPVGAYGGRADIMKKVMPAGPVFQAGTLSGNPLAMAAGHRHACGIARESALPRLEQLSARRWSRDCAAASAAGVPHQFNRVGSMWTLFFTADAGHRLRHGRKQRHGPLRPVLLGDDGSRRLFAVQPVRGGVYLGGSYDDRRTDDVKAAEEAIQAMASVDA